MLGALIGRPKALSWRLVLAVGTIAPDIRAVTTGGSTFVLSEQEGLCTVVYFYPKAFTPVCSAETKRFTDNYAEIALAGATIVGISTDDGTTQCRFAQAMKTPYPLIGDHDKSIARAWDVLWPILGLAQRVTYVVAPSRRVLAAVHHELIGVERHRDDVLRLVHERLEATRAH